ncbi:site-specific integrase [Photobacterium sp. ZSDE20]|uniref:Site-specific integrase n=1 Tax=Photobacterium pectinilyticum TaxID=2906793 RepID=A0ABT1N7T4_9GAMM|nr:site-specific integrase [Photobacterium sp. ZSDE20]MCQ1060815.1 site-specific integrase [Photobacterium sp. ZSDE20]MDD1828561.1 site-specific integrase [Photobacterium sp. ZSDE20]
MKITDARLRHIVGKPYSGAPQIAYEKGLSLRISPKGKVTWVLRYNFNGSPVRVKLGEYPAMKIKEAKDKRDEYKLLVSKGIDPRGNHIKLGVNSPKTISALIEYYIENSLMESNKQWPAIESLLRRSIIPHIGDYPADDIERADYVCLFKLEKERAGAKHATRLLYRFKSILNYGVRHGFLKQNHLNHLKGSDVGEMSKPVKRKLIDVEIGALWVCIDTLPYHETMKNLLKLTMIFGSRVGELRLSEKSHFDFEMLTWTVPAENHKMGRKSGAEIVRSIPVMAEEILKQQIEIEPDFKYMFPQYYIVKDKPLNQKTPYRPSLVLAQMMTEMGYTETRNHDMRRTARNAWEALDFPEKVSETMIGHKVHKGVQAHYLEYYYLDEQLDCYEEWCDYILRQTEIFLRQKREHGNLRVVS